MDIKPPLISIEIIVYGVTIVISKPEISITTATTDAPGCIKLTEQHPKSGDTFSKLINVERKYFVQPHNFIERFEKLKNEALTKLTN